jgi:meiotically up-regulated gene 157 (Mug157) protein
MDDANVPSLLSIPYLGYKHYDPEVYANTRKFVFSPDNPTYQTGTNALTGPIEGYGSPHMKTAIKSNIWPMSLAMQGLTSDSVDEKVRLVETLWKASAGTGWMHESIDVLNPKKFTRRYVLAGEEECGTAFLQRTKVSNRFGLLAISMFSW